MEKNISRQSCGEADPALLPRQKIRVGKRLRFWLYKAKIAAIFRGMAGEKQ